MQEIQRKQKEIDALRIDAALRQSENPLALQDLLETLEDDRDHHLEHALHKCSNGPYYLENPQLARVVYDACLWLEQHKGLKVFAFCIMSNHVHLLAGSASGIPIAAGPIMKTLKGYTGRKCNQLLDRHGHKFWEKNYYDRDVRPNTFYTVIWYILNNPVKAGLVDQWQDWPFTYLCPDLLPLFADPDLNADVE